MATAILTHERLLEVLHYNPDTGIFTWRIKIGRGQAFCRPGDVAGGYNGAGYITIGLDNGRYMAHCLAWFYVHGKWADGDVDHRFGIRDDNRIAELRDISHRANGENQRLPSINNKSGALGVSWDKTRGRWKAQIQVDGRNKLIGRFRSVEEAAVAYATAKRLHHVGCTI